MKRQRNTEERKTQQLCRQVERRLSLVLAGELEDQRLEGISIIDVTPVQGAALLCVHVALPPGKTNAEAAEVHQRLLAASGWLRREIAAAISRKKTPQLTFSIETLNYDDENGPA